MSQKNFIRALQNRFLGNTKFLLFLIVAFGLLLRLVFFSGMGTSDDLSYSSYSYNVDKGINKDITVTLEVRIGIIYATALSYTIFGVNDFSSVLFVLLTSLGSIILIFYFGKLLFDEKAGLMAAFLLSFFPLDIAYSTKLLTDLPSAFFMALGVYFFLYSEIKSKMKYGIGYFLSGIFIGIGYLIKETAVLIGLFFITYNIFKKRIKKEYFFVPLGFLAIFAVDVLVFYVSTGDPFFRIFASQQYLAKVIESYGYFGRLSFPLGLLHYPYMFLTDNLISYFYIFIFIAIGYCLVYKKREAYNMLFWLIPSLLYLSFGSSSISQYIPFNATSRYLSIITIPGILLLSFFLTEKNELIKKLFMPIALILLLFASLGSLYLYGERNILGNLKDSYPILEKLDKPIFIDGRSITALDYISKYKNDINPKEYPDDLTKIKDAYVIINRDMIKRLEDAHKQTKFKKEVHNPPESWIVVKEIGEDDKSKVVIYYAP